MLPIIFLGILGAVIGLLIAFGAKRFYVYADQRLPKIIDILPHFDCGACGFAECSRFARAVAQEKADICGCVPGGPRVAHEIADVMNTTVTVEDPKMAVVHCKGGTSEVLRHCHYHGIIDCHAALLESEGEQVCTDGCLGLGSCEKVCAFGAIKVNLNGVAVVDIDKCTGCGMCVAECPRGIVELIPRVYKIFLACSNHDRGAKVKRYCSVGCTACTLCVKTTASGAISMKDNLPLLDYESSENFVAAAYKCPSRSFVDLVKARPKVNIDTKCDGCTECVRVCPVGAILGERGQRHVIEKEKCIGCGICLNVCHAHAISLWGGLGQFSTQRMTAMRRT